MVISPTRDQAGGLSPLPLVTIVALNWNGEQHIHRCLQSAAGQTYPNIEFILVDNGSNDGSLAKIKARYPQFHYVENGCNLGYARGMNTGLAAAHGDFVVVLCQDVCIDQNFVARCVERIAKDDGIGAIGGRVFSWIGDELTTQVRKGEGERFFIRKRFQGDGGHPSADETWTLIGAPSFAFLRRAALDDIRSIAGFYFDESYGNYWEDFDLFLRLHLRGWKTLFFPSAFGWHVGSGSVGGNATWLSKPFDSQVNVLRNRYLTIIKNLSAPMLLWLCPYLLAAEVAIPPYLVLRSPKTLLAWLRAWGQVLRQSGTLFKKRRAIQRSRKVDPMSLRQYFVRF